MHPMYAENGKILARLRVVGESSGTAWMLSRLGQWFAVEVGAGGCPTGVCAFAPTAREAWAGLERLVGSIEPGDEKTRAALECPA
jgi:hypothetical protein